MRVLACVGVLFSQLFISMTADASSQYFDIPVWPGDEEYCPAPGNIQNDRGVFSSPAKAQGVDWVGVLPNDEIENVVAFEKAVFVLAEKNSETLGFLSSCIYTTSKGRYLSMRPGAGNKPDEVMWIVRLSSWSRSKAYSSRQILECTDKGERACAFFVK